MAVRIEKDHINRPPPKKGEPTRHETVVPGRVIKVEWWNGKQWHTTWDARPEPRT